MTLSRYAQVFPRAEPSALGFVCSYMLILRLIFRRPYLNHSKPHILILVFSLFPDPLPSLS